MVRIPRNSSPNCYSALRSIQKPPSSGLHWRREGDSNPRYGFPYTSFPRMRDRPLCHLSMRDSVANYGLLCYFLTGLIAQGADMSLNPLHKQLDGQIISAIDAMVKQTFLRKASPKISRSAVIEITLQTEGEAVPPTVSIFCHRPELLQGNFATTLG